MNSYGLIFVLYEPTEEFLENLARARAFCPNLVAVDNSPEADLPLHDFLREQGIRLLYDVPRRGTANSRINFVHPKDAGGVLIELVEPAADSDADH